MSLLIKPAVVFFLCGFLFSGPAYSQNWVKQMGSAGYQIGESIAIDASGNNYTTGRFTGTVDFDPGAGVFNLTSQADDIFIVKLNTNGDFVWAKDLGGTGNDIGTSIQINGGNIYLAGTFNGTADFDPSAATFNLTSAGATDFFISKLDVNGNFVWAKKVGGTSLDKCSSIALDIAGNIYATGNFFSSIVDFDPGATVSNLTSAGGADIFILKLDNNGNFVWARQMGAAGSDSGNSITVSAAGNVHLAGSFNNTVDFDPGAGTTNLASLGSSDIFISKFNTSGNIIWAKSIGSNSFDHGYSLITDAAENVYATGEFSNTADFDPGAGVFSIVPEESGANAFVVKLASSGNFLWANQFAGPFGGTTGNSIALDGVANVYVIGEAYDGDDDDIIILAELDANGNKLVVDESGGRGSGNSLTADAPGNVYATGNFDGTVNFSLLDCLGSLSGGSRDIFILKTKTNALTRPTITSFSPTLGLAGTTVIITGTNFSTTQANNKVYFGGEPAIVTASTATSITTSVPASAATGKISVSAGCGTATSSTDFIVDCGLAPTISSFSPASGTLGTTVIITGTNFSTTTSDNVVDFDGYPAVVTASTSTSITTTVPTGPIGPQPINITIGCNTVTSSINFDVSCLPAPTITSFTPTTGVVGAVITITGTNFSTNPINNLVYFNGEAAIVTASTATTITTTVPINAITSPIVVFVGCDGAASTDDFIVDCGPTPTITSFAPTTGAVGDVVIITGTNFSTNSIGNEVDFNGGLAIVTASTTTTITTTVPANAVTGPITIFVGCDGAASTDDFVVDTNTTPRVTSFSPTSGLIGTSVTITGTNFSTTSASNTVYFGATKATVTAATTTQLTVTVPSGATYQPISVLVNGLTAFSAKPFITTFADGGVIDACAFAAKVDFTAEINPYTVAIGDLDSDGKTDIAIANASSNTISIFKNISTTGTISVGSFAPKVDFTTGTYPQGIFIKDLDGDGKPEIGVANNNGNTVSIFRNTSTTGSINTSSFAPKVDFATALRPHDIAIHDFDGDGRPDLAITNDFSSSVSVLKNTSTAGSINTGSFAPKVDFVTGTGPKGIAALDIDGDGKPDLAVTNESSFTVSVLRNTAIAGTITGSSFAAKVDFATGPNPVNIAIGDLDTDGKPDLAVANSDDGTVSILRNTSTAGIINTSSFATNIDFFSGGGYGIEINDLDGDGKPDLVTNSSPSKIAVLKNVSNSGSITISSFGAPVEFAITSNIEGGIAIGDLDGDGKPDIVASGGTNKASVLRNTVSGLPSFTASAFSPPSGPVGTTVTITGTNFSTTPLNNTVKFNGVVATVTASTSTSITVVVPSGATTGAISLEIGCNTALTIAPFTVTSSSTITITIQPLDASICLGATTSFTTSATGTTNIIYQWQFSSTLAGAYNDIANGGGYSNVATASLSVNTTGNFGVGFYRCKVNGDFATTVFTNAAQLTVNAIPTAPTVVAANRCGNGSVTLTASGGSNGQYKWYTVATGGTAIAGEVNSTYTTPSLSSTTTYFVSLAISNCESTRTSVTAIITTTIAPTATGASACPGSTFTLTASGGTNGQYKWYTVASGGTAIVGEVNGSYTTPVQNATTNYYVTLTTGGCESTRTPVTATVSATGCEPVIATSKLVTQVEGTIILDLKLLITTPGTLDVNSIKIKSLPSSGATAVITNGVLTIDYKGKPFSGIESIVIEACNTNGICSQQTFDIEVAGDIVVYNAVSPNDDKLNEFFKLEYIQALSPKNQVSIYNRWGDEVFSIADYDNNTRVFAGLTNDGGKLPSGTYYYKIVLTDVGKTLTGFISLKY